MWRLRAPIGRLRDRADIAAFRNHLANPEAVIERLLPFDVIWSQQSQNQKTQTASFENRDNAT
jgi:hypothetical protein